jgi:hypothetical protein
MGLVTCKCIHATKSKTGTLGLWMGLVKLVKFHENHPGGFYQKKSNICLLDTFSCEVIDFVEKMNLPCQIFFVEGS